MYQNQQREWENAWGEWENAWGSAERVGESLHGDQRSLVLIKIDSVTGVGSSGVINNARMGLTWR
jgi:hypothetical protein